MPPSSAEILEALNTPEIRQYSVFLANRVGALLRVVQILGEADVMVLGLSIQDAAETSVARMITSDPDRLEQLFAEHDIAYGACGVLVVELEDGVGDLGRMLAALLEAEVNILFSYPLLVRPQDRPLVALHVDDNECAGSVLQGRGFRLLRQGDLSR